MLSNELSGQILSAAAALRRGGMVAFPTETVYGLGADAENPEAVGRIFAAKGRPAGHPLIVHLASVAQISRFAEDVSAAAWRLAEHFWPGPLTLILRRGRRVPDVVTGGQDTVGLRSPDHPMALALLAAFGSGIAAPSANRFGRVSPTTAGHVREELGESVDVILDGGQCRVGIESTILDLSAAHPRLLRPGTISIAEIEAVLGESVAGPGQAGPRAPGMMCAHYAPATPVQLAPADVMEREVNRCMGEGRRKAVLAFSMTIRHKGCVWHIMPSEPIGYARELYAGLRALDAAGCDVILVEAPPQDAAWHAVRDRLERAQSHFSLKSGSGTASR